MKPLLCNVLSGQSSWVGIEWLHKRVMFPALPAQNFIFGSVPAFFGDHLCFLPPVPRKKERKKRKLQEESIPPKAPLSNILADQTERQDMGSEQLAVPKVMMGPCRSEVFSLKPSQPPTKIFGWQKCFSSKRHWQKQNFFVCSLFYILVFRDLPKQNGHWVGNIRVKKASASIKSLFCTAFSQVRESVCA